MRTKKWISLLLAVIMVVTMLTGCSGLTNTKKDDRISISMYL